jgi:uncharacterized membrane protein
MATTDAQRIKRLTGLLGVSGVLHLVAPKPYERIVPPQLGSARKWVVGSGVVEVACAAALALPQTRKLGALASAALFVAVFPANLYAIKLVGDNKVARAGAIARLPMQIPMITAALKVARDADAQPA